MRHLAIVGAKVIRQPVVGRRKSDSMQSAEKLAEYRRMTPAERLRLTFELIEEGWPYLNLGTEDQVRRKHQRIRQQNDLFNRRVLDALSRTKRATT